MFGTCPPINPGFRDGVSDCPEEATVRQIALRTPFNQSFRDSVRFLTVDIRVSRGFHEG